MAKPVWMYRKVGDHIEALLFQDGNVPSGEGWVDTPAKLKIEEKRKPGRPRKVKADGDG